MALNPIIEIKRYNGDDVYNKEEYKDNKEEYIATEVFPLSSSGRTSSSESVEALPQGSPEPRERRSGIDSLPPPISQDDVKRAYVTFFKNAKRNSISVRLNLNNNENVQFIASLQPRGNITSFLRHTGTHKEEAREWFVALRKHCKDTYGNRPQTGKFHLNNYLKTDKLQPTTVEPGCYASVVYDPYEKGYKAWLLIYDFSLESIDLDDSNLSQAQRNNNVRGSHLYINPTHDKRTRPLTWAERTGRSK
jgi:hypothetical protein